MIFLGNKQDLDAQQQRAVLKEDVAEWVFCELPKLRAKVRAAAPQQQPKAAFEHQLVVPSKHSANKERERERAYASQ